MLQGSFDTFDFPEVLGLLARKHQTGKLHLHHGAAVVDLYLSDGKLNHAESTDHGLPVRVADSRSRLEEACFEVLRWDHGSFEFHPNSQPGSGRNLDAGVEGVLAGARRRMDEWDRVQQLIPSLEVQPRLVAEVEQDEVRVSRSSWRILAALDGRRTGVALARSLGLSHFELSFALAELLAAGLIEITARPKVSIAAPAARSTSLPTIRRAGADGASFDDTAGSAAPGSSVGTDTAAAAGEAAAPEPAPAGASLSSRLGRLRVRPANG